MAKGQERSGAKLPAPSCSQILILWFELLARLGIVCDNRRGQTSLCQGAAQD